MKKYLTLALAFLMSPALAGCGVNETISLPAPEEIRSVEIVGTRSGNQVSFTDQGEIDQVIETIEGNTKDWKRQSNYDQSVNVDDYYTLSLHLNEEEENPTTVYLYQRGFGWRSYIEQPYAGIWRIKKDSYEEIGNLLLEQNE